MVCLFLILFCELNYTLSLLNFPLFCPKCKKETRVNIVKLKMTISNEPDA